MSCSANKQVRFTNVNPQGNEISEAVDSHSYDHSEKKKRVHSGSAKKKMVNKTLNEKKAVKQTSPFVSRNNRV